MPEKYSGHRRTPTKLRVEIRNYMDPVEGKGLYVDAIRVEAVD